jgi:hypothetical protein
MILDTLKFALIIFACVAGFVGMLWVTAYLNEISMLLGLAWLCIPCGLLMAGVVRS